MFILGWLVILLCWKKVEVGLVLELVEVWVVFVEVVDKFRFYVIEGLVC